MIDGKRLRELRKSHGLSAQELATVLGIGVAQISRYETEKTDATTDVLIKFAKFFNVSTDYLLGLADDLPKEAYKWMTIASILNHLKNRFGEEQLVGMIKSL